MAESAGAAPAWLPPWPSSAVHQVSLTPGSRQGSRAAHTLASSDNGSQREKAFFSTTLPVVTEERPPPASATGAKSPEQRIYQQAAVRSQSRGPSDTKDPFKRIRP